MGTHPIFESDFDCLTDIRIEMRCLILYQRLNGTPRRLLSVSSRLSLRGGQSSESDDPVPREFIEAAYILSEDQRPNAMVLQEKDMTPELIAEKAKKYNMIPEDYLPMSISWGGAYGGDYPTIVEEAFYNKDFNYEWDDFKGKRNFGEVIGMHQYITYSSWHHIFDGVFHPYGLWQWDQNRYLYISAYITFISLYFICHWFDFRFNVRTSYERYYMANQKTGQPHDRSWSHTELEWKDVFLKVNRLKEGYASRSFADQDFQHYRQCGIHFSMFKGYYGGRNRRGP